MRNQTERESEGDLLKGLVAGAVSGLIASWVMNQFQATWHQMAEGEQRGHGAQSMQQGSPSGGVAEELKERNSENPDDDAPQRLAKYISEEGFGHKLTKSEKDAAGTALHYAFGVSSATAYSVAAEFLPQVTLGAGLPFGALVWLAADEIVTPLLGLSKPADEYPLSTHAYALSSHLVYGLTAEMTRRAVRDVL